MSPFSDFSNKKIKAVWAFAEGKSAAEAAAIAGCAERSVYRWQKEPEFQEAVKYHRSRVFESSICSLVEKMQSSITVLTTIAEDTSKPATARVNAAKNILLLGMRGWMVSDINHAIRVVKKYGGEIRFPKISVEEGEWNSFDNLELEEDE